MFDPEKALTVEQYIVQKGIVGKVWVCPHLVSTGKISNPPSWCGIECTASTIPEEVKHKKVKNRFREMDTECIVWYNDEDYSYQEVNNNEV